jgi:hypothetical protein
MSNMNAIYEEEYKGFTIEIVPDSTIEDPRDWRDGWSGALTYNSGDNMPNFKDVAYADLDVEDDWDTWLRAEHKSNPIAFAIPVRIDDYGSDGWRMVWDAPWRPGPVFDVYYRGRAYNAMYVVRKSDVRENRAIKRITAKHLKDELRCALFDLREYRAVLEGEVYGYVVKDADGEVEDDCWGYIGDYEEEGGCLTEARRQVDYLAIGRDKIEVARQWKAAIAAASGL